MGNNQSKTITKTFAEMYPKLSDGLKQYYNIVQYYKYRSLGTIDSYRFNADITQRREYVYIDSKFELQTGQPLDDRFRCPCGKLIKNVEWITKDNKLWYGIGSECVDRFNARAIYCKICNKKCSSYKTETCKSCKDRQMFPNYYKKLDEAKQSTTVPETLTISQQISQLCSIRVEKGKYNNQTIKHVVQDGNYIDWLITNKQRPDLVTYYNRLKDLLERQEDQQLLNNITTF